MAISEQITYKIIELNKNVFLSNVLFQFNLFQKIVRISDNIIW